MGSLKDLQKHRKDILLAEIAAWLHDVRKAGIRENWVPEDYRKWLESRDVSGIHLYNDSLDKWLVAQCHGIAHFDKQSPDSNAPTSQYISSPFGFEKTKHRTTKFRPKWLKTKDDLYSPTYAGEVLKKAYADSRVPINEVDLWSWAQTTASLNKASWIKALKQNENLSVIFLDHDFLKDLDRTFQALLQRDDEKIRIFLNDLKVPTSSRPQSPFRGLKTQVTDENGTPLLMDWITHLGSWLQHAQKVSSTNRLTQTHWERLVKKLEELYTILEKTISLLSWRLLSVRTNGLEYIFSSSSIPDLLARKELLTDAWNRVQKVLEEEYPLGLEIYRDENGPVFVVPDLENLLGLENPDDNHKTLREYILEAFRQGTVKEDSCLVIDGEVIPVFKLDEKPWRGQPAPAELPPIGEHLEDFPPLQSDPMAIAQAWCNHNDEICSVCGLRPQGPGSKAQGRKMCAICEERRADRAKMWAEGTLLSSEERFWQGKPDTIWLDEVADVNRRLALIVGCFGLEHWLSGTLVQSLAVRNPKNVSDKTKTEKVAKNPSFARLRRIWETTRRFWQDVAPTDAPPKELRDFCHDNDLDPETFWEGPSSLETSVAGKAMAEKHHRIFLKAENTDELAKDLGPFHAYEMVVQGRKVAVLWVPPKGTDAEDLPEGYRGGFWVIENLDYLEGLFGKPMEQVLQKDTVYEIYEPSEYGRPGRAIARFTLVEKKTDAPGYTPLIPILAEPRTFMALVPADKALEVVRAIKIKYEREMGKVRNRLPLHLGIVFADSHQPLRIILDAGRRMLRQKAKPLLWKVICPARKQVEKSDSLPSGYEEDKEKQFKEWYEILLESQEDENRKLIWYVPALMGDGQTEDFWYPFVFLKQKEEPKGREIYYWAHNPWNADHSWLVHVSNLRPGDIIYFTPATLDFIWLDHSGTRFEIVYDENGLRLATLHRPYLLDELEKLIECWKKLKEGLSLRQILRVRNLIETKRAEWFENPRASVQDEMFRKFCRSVLVNAEWKSGHKPDDATLARLIHWAVSGLLADTVELHHHIMKQDKDIGEETP